MPKEVTNPKTHKTNTVKGHFFQQHVPGICRVHSEFQEMEFLKQRTRDIKSLLAAQGGFERLNVNGTPSKISLSDFHGRYNKQRFV